MTINKDYPCNKRNYGNKRSLKSIKYIVLHYNYNITYIINRYRLNLKNAGINKSPA